MCDVEAVMIVHLNALIQGESSVDRVDVKPLFTVQGFSQQVIGGK